MVTINAQNRQTGKYFCIFDYYLDGVFLKYEEILGECPVINPGEKIVVELDNGNQVEAKVVDSDFISESERHVYLSSV